MTPKKLNTFVKLKKNKTERTGKEFNDSRKLGKDVSIISPTWILGCCFLKQKSFGMMQTLFSWQQGNGRKRAAAFRKRVGLFLLAKLARHLQQWMQ